LYIFFGFATIVIFLFSVRSCQVFRTFLEYQVLDLNFTGLTHPRGNMANSPDSMMWFLRTLALITVFATPFSLAAPSLVMKNNISQPVEVIALKSGSNNSAITADNYIVVMKE